MKEQLSVKEIAEILGMDKQKTYRLIHKIGLKPSAHEGNKVLYEREVIETLKENRFSFKQNLHQESVSGSAQKTNESSDLYQEIISLLKSQIEEKDKQIIEKDNQIRELTSIIAMQTLDKAKNKPRLLSFFSRKKQETES